MPFEIPLKIFNSFKWIEEQLRARERFDTLPGTT